MEEQTQENKFPSLKTTGVSKPFWYLIKYTSNIQLDTDEQGVLFKTSETRFALEEFDKIEEALAYFDDLKPHIGENFNVEIVYDYLGSRESKK